ncbi:MAG: sigma-70 family RNA polymerase sigma factor [Muribaculaceae bacterium]|nr:sigma-70 family RNA polymerase sigma factor [Muribaculaceae bacterium]
MESNLATDFERLVMEHKSTIYSVCYMFVDTRAEADDLFQEVLINLWNGFDAFRGESAIRSWVYRVSMNTCISYKRKKRITTVPLDIAPDVIGDDSPASRQAEQLHKRISLLEPIDRAIVLLWLENLPYDEIASIIGITPRNVSVRLVRIKEKLKTL